jgi:hypothetical protein
MRFGAIRLVDRDPVFALSMKLSVVTRTTRTTNRQDFPHGESQACHLLRGDHPVRMKHACKLYGGTAGGRLGHLNPRPRSCAPARRLVKFGGRDAIAVQGRPRISTQGQRGDPADAAVQCRKVGLTVPRGKRFGRRLTGDMRSQVVHAALNVRQMRWETERSSALR